MTDECSHYDAEHLWGNAPQPYQVHARADILSMVPADTRSVLDVGCGDGFVTNALAPTLSVIGLDLSKRALQHVSGRAVAASAVQIPFRDRSFDLVMANDVIEHIPPEEYPQSLAEIARVAGRYALITVPCGEQLEAHQAKCAACGKIYHVNWHQRVLDAAAMPRLLGPRFRLLELRYSGHDTLPPFDPTIGLRHSLGLFHSWPAARCPSCGSASQVGSDEQSPLREAIATLCSSLWADTVRSGRLWNSRTEIIGLYGAGDTQAALTADSTPRLAESMANPLDIDFSNPLQNASSGFTAGSLWSRYLQPDGALADAQGIRRSSPAQACLTVSPRIPVAPRIGDRIVVEASAGGAGGMVSVEVVDGLLWSRQQVLQSPVTAERQRFEVPVERAWHPSSTGLVIDVHLQGDVVLHALRYGTDPPCVASFVYLSEGHNVFRVADRGCHLSWGFVADAAGRYPKPLMPLKEPPPPPAPSDESICSSLLKLLADAVGAASRDAEQRLALLEWQETQREQAETAYAQSQVAYQQLQGEHARLSSLLDEKEGQRTKAEAAYAKSQVAYQQLQGEHARLSTLLDEKEAQRSRAEAANTQSQVACQQLHGEHARLSTLLEQKEAQASRAEAALLEAQSVCQQLQSQNTELLVQLEQKERHRHAAEVAYGRQGQELQTVVERLEDARREVALRRGFWGGSREILRTVKRRLVGPPLGRVREVCGPPWKALPTQPAPRPDQIKVLVLSHMFPHPDAPVSGPFVLEQVRALREHAGIDARVLCGRPFWMCSLRNPIHFLRKNRQYWDFHQSCDWMEIDGVPVLYLPYRVFGGFWCHGWSYRAAFLQRLAAIREKFAFDLVHAHTGYLDGSAGRAIARRLRVPLVITEHTGPFSSLTNNWITRRWTLASLRNADRTIAVSHAQANTIREHLAPPRRDRVLVVPNGVDTTVFHASPVPRHNGLAPRVFFVGHLVPVKNIPLLLEAFALVCKALPDALLTLVGPPESPQYESKLRDDAARLGLGGRVSFLGALPRDRVAKVLREECDLLVLSSESETFGCVLVEALACGRPVVSTRCGGPEDIVSEPFLGRLCANHDPVQLANAILDVAGNLSSYSPARIRRHVEVHLSYQTVARRIADVYREVIRA